MGMKYLISESKVRKAVRTALRNSPQDGWTINEGFIESFFDAIANSLGDLRRQYETQQTIEVNAKMRASRASLIDAIDAKIESDGIKKRSMNDPAYLDRDRAFTRYNWGDQEITNIVIELLSVRLASSSMNSVSQIEKVAQLPPIPGLSSSGSSPSKKETDPAKQEEAVDAESKAHVETIRLATDVVTKTLGDIVTIMTSDQAVSEQLNQLVAQAGFGVTAVDFLHKIAKFDEIIKSVQYGSKFEKRLGPIIMPVSQRLAQAASRGLSKYAEQNNYKSGIAFNALPSDLLKTAATKKSGQEPVGQDKGADQA